MHFEQVEQFLILDACHLEDLSRSIGEVAVIQSPQEGEIGKNPERWTVCAQLILLAYKVDRRLDTNRGVYNTHQGCRDLHIKFPRCSQGLALTRAVDPAIPVPKAGAAHSMQFSGQYLDDRSVSPVKVGSQATHIQADTTADGDQRLLAPVELYLLDLFSNAEDEVEVFVVLAHGQHEEVEIGVVGFKVGTDLVAKVRVNVGINNYQALGTDFCRTPASRQLQRVGFWNHAGQ